MAKVEACVRSISSKAEKMSSARPQNKRLCLMDWLNVALLTLKCEGIDKVKVQILAGKLGVSRTNFYWHFRDREALLQAMLDYWKERNTVLLTEKIACCAPTGESAGTHIVDIWKNREVFDRDLDIAVRLWARHSASVEKMIKDADRERVEAILRKFLETSMPVVDAESRAELFYYALIGENLLKNKYASGDVAFGVPAYIGILSGDF